MESYDTHASYNHRLQQPDLIHLQEMFPQMIISRGQVILVTGAHGSGRSFVAKSMIKFLRYKMNIMDKQLLNIVKVKCINQNRRDFDQLVDHVQENCSQNHITILPIYCSLKSTRDKLKDAFGSYVVEVVLEEQSYSHDQEYEPCFQKSNPNAIRIESKSPIVSIVGSILSVLIANRTLEITQNGQERCSKGIQPWRYYISCHGCDIKPTKTINLAPGKSEFHLKSQNVPPNQRNLKVTLMFSTPWKTNSYDKQDQVYFEEFKENILESDSMTSDTYPEEYVQVNANDEYISMPGICRLTPEGKVRQLTNNLQFMKLSDAIKMIAQDVDQIVDQKKEFKTNKVQILCTFCRGGNEHDLRAKGIKPEYFKYEQLEAEFDSPKSITTDKWKKKAKRWHLVVAEQSILGFRISCQSDSWKAGRKYMGIILYKYGNYPAKAGISPGYVYIKDTTDKERGYHAVLVTQVFDVDKSVMEKAGAVMGGFGGDASDKVTAVSRTLNLSNTKYQDTNKYMSAGEVNFITQIYKKWKEGGPGTSIYIKDATPTLFIK